MSSSCRRKKHNRRSALEIDKSFNCPYHNCDKQFGSDGSLNLHIKIKHNGGTKTEREKMATLLIEAYVEAIKQGTEANIDFKQEVIDQIQLNLPPGILTQTAQKSGLMTFDQIQTFDEVKILEIVNARLAPKFRELICLTDQPTDL